MSSSTVKPDHGHESEQTPNCCGPAGPDHQRIRFLKRGIYEHFRWPFKFVQIIGYVSFEHGQQYESDEISFFESGSICTRFPKCQIAYPIFCILLGLGCMSYYWIFGSYYFEKKFSLFYSLENLVLVVLGVSASTWILFLKVYGLIYRRRAVAFLKSTITDVANGINSLNVHNEDCRRVMDKLRRGTLNMIALYLTIIGVHLFALGFINNIVIAYFTGSNFGDLANAAITIVWDLICYGHVGLSIWVTSYLKLYLSCMQILNLELQIFEMCHTGQVTRDNDHDHDEPLSQSRPESRSSPSPPADVHVHGDGDPEVRQQRQKRPINRGRRTKNTVEPIELSTLPPITIPLPSILKSPGAQSTHSWLDEFTKMTGQDKDKESNHEHEHENEKAYEEVEVKIPREPQPPSMAVRQPHLSKCELQQQFEPILKNCIRFYYLIETCMENFNAFFSTVLVIEFLYCIAVVIAMSFYLYVVVIENPQPPPIIIQGAVTLLLHVLVLCYYSTTPALMAEETKKVLSKLQVISLQPLSSEMRYMMQILVTKISSSSPEPSPGRFFTINRTLITSIVSALSTYLVILIQFRQEDRRRIKVQ